MARDSAGNLFILAQDQALGNYAVYELTAASSWTSISAVTSATLINPYGIALDHSGNLIVSDIGSSAGILYKAVKSGSTYNFTTLISQTTSINGFTLNSPGQLAVGSSGAIYLADMNNKRIVIVGP
jgi:serine/threonine-protein kinase